MAEENINCDVGILTNTQCHLTSYTNKKDLYNLESFPVNDILNLKYRIDNFLEIAKGKICDHHRHAWLLHYSRLHRKCCDPFKVHNKNITTDLRILNLDICENALMNLFMRLKPGDKVCKNCQYLLKSKIESVQKNVHSSIDPVASSSTEIRRWERIEKQEKKSDSQVFVLPNSQYSIESSATTVTTDSDFTTLSQQQKLVNTVLNNLNLPNVNDYPFYKSRRLQNAENIIQEVCENFAELFSKASNINTVVPEPVTDNILEDCTAFREMLTNLQKEFESAQTILKKLEYLALLPRDWNRSKIQLYFNCTNWMYAKLSHFKEMDGFPDNLKSHMRRSYSKISSEMQQIISKYYINDSNTYTCPGRKEYVTKFDEDGRKIYVQKKILLYTVHDLYLNFLDEYTGNEKLPSYSFFVSLKPVECIHAGDPGSHYICVCAEHQNVKLMLYAISRILKYRDLLVSAVCDIDNAICMTKKCSNCPGKEGVLKKFENLVKQYDIEIKKGKIKYKNWIESGSAASLETFEAHSDDLRNQLCENINNLTFHHYVADTQKQYLSHCKNNLEVDTCVILMDFSENYSFIIQHSVQAFFYNNSQATLHPFCIYFKTEESDELQNVNYCVISDTKDHYAYTINAFTAKLMTIIKEKYEWIKKVIYFSDGAPQQYKNKNHLANVLCHEEDFNIKVKSYNFFATSHGKSPCDAIGGVLKRQVMRHCIRSPPEGQITNAQEMYEYAVNKSENIRVLWVPHTDVQKYERKLHKRFSRIPTFPQTRLHHCYIPVEGKSMIMKITSISSDSKTVNLNIT